MNIYFYNRAKLFLICISLLFSVGGYSQCSSCVLTGWQYEKEITIDNSAVSTSSTNIQELITIDTQTPISQSKMDPAGNDIRFVDSDCSVSLCYWIESGINTSTTKIWVTLPSLAANSIKTFFMFYGNTSATASSNLSCVFSNILTVNGTVTLAGNQNYDLIDIQSGSTVNIGTGQILAFKARKITVAGTINGDNSGNGAAAGTGAGGNGGGSDGGGGGGYGGTGGSGKCPGNHSGSVYGTASGMDIDMGSGGGGSDCDATGGGGGAVKLEATDIDITGSISVNGYTTPGSCGSGEAPGGGSGGGILVYANTINGNGILTAKGGNGQDSGGKEGGGGGGGGRIKLFYCSANNFSGTTSVAKGIPGVGGQCSADDAQDGTSTVNTFTCESITLGPEQNSIYETPTSNFIAPSQICALTDSVIVYTGNALSNATYTWSFGGGIAIPGTGQGPHTAHWTTSGTKNVTLTVTSVNGCTSSTSSTSVIVNAIPTASAGGDISYCSGDSAAMGGATTLGYIYLWSPSAGLNNASIANPTIHLTNLSNSITPVNYIVTTSSNGCSSKDTTTVTVSPKPVSSFTSPSAQCSKNNSFNFIAGGTFLPSANFLWTYGSNGTPATSILQNPSGVSFSTTGSQTVTLTVSQNGCISNTFIDSVTVYPNPIADFTVADVCFGQPLDFHNTSTFPNGSTPDTVVYNHGDGSPLSSGEFYYCSGTGPYDITQTVISNNGCSDTATHTAVVHPIPVVSFSATNACDGIAVPFISLSTISSPDAIQSWQWDFGDSNHATTQNTSHDYAVSGTHTVQLVVVSSFGCADSVSETIVVNPVPIVNFIVSDSFGCAPLCVSFQNQSTGGSVLSVWNFGDSTSASDPNHCYINDSIFVSQSFNVTLTVTSDRGCVGASTKNNYITVYPTPKADFSAQPQTTTITDPIISIVNSSAGANAWKWNFGDLQTSAISNPASHGYLDTGTYVITLIVSNQHSCADTISHTIVIEPDFLFYIPTAFTPDGDGINDVFTGIGIFIKEFEMTIFDRWGNLIYKTTDINKPWDGKTAHEAEPSERDVYVYAFTVTDFKTLKHNFKGIVTLIR
jgi:gliding motility-associated-like protein